MGFLRTDIDEAKNPEEKRELKWLFERYLECDRWAIKTIPYKRLLELKAPESEGYRKIRPPYDVGVLLTAHPGGRAYLKASIETHKKLGFWICLAYDNYFDPKRRDIKYDDMLPARDVMDMVDLFVMPHHQVWGGVLYPYFWLLKFGIASMSTFPYIYCANGDCIIEKPKGFPKLMGKMGDADIMGIGCDESCFYTAAFIAKTEALQAIMEHMERHFIPFETYEKYTNEIGNCEARMARAIRDLGLKQVVVEPPNNEQLHVKGKGTWYKLLGLRHLHGEHNYAYRYHKEPPEIKYFDQRFMGNEYSRIKEYWECKKSDPEKAQQILKDWWAK